MIIRWCAGAIGVVEELSDPVGEDVTEAEDTDALGVSRGIPAVGDKVIDDIGATAGADDIDTLPVPVGIGEGLAVAVVVGVAVAVAMSRGVPAVGDMVIMTQVPLRELLS